MYRGHSAHICNIAFTYDDSYCISTGGDDHCVIVWSADVQEVLLYIYYAFSYKSTTLSLSRSVCLTIYLSTSLTD